MKIVDISRYFEEGTEIEVKLQDNLPIYEGHPCKAYDLFIKSHAGTYFETTSHLFTPGENTDEFPLEKLVRDVSIVDVPNKYAAIGKKALTECGPHVINGDALLIRTARRDECYLERNAAEWMKNKEIPFFGMNSKLYDTGFENPTGIFVDLFKAGIAIIANIDNLDEITKSRAKIIVLPIKVKGVSTAPCRAIVIED